MPAALSALAVAALGIDTPEFGIKDRLPDAARDLVMNTPHAGLLMTTRLVTAPCHVDARLK
ncbi:hypothetical protein [Pseudomonas sp. PH1b]|uniref:hypothetical protein n=1 Tax=Pseudomonas sp. PH1b TaxID=1397282 RepID=UPI000A725405|nr:hypothetical protein FFPRI1PSEUD_64280 [Pseudomonas sp. FFPRI_1]